MLNAFDDDKQLALQTGDISERSYREYIADCDVITTVGKYRPIDSLTADDLKRIRRKLSKGKSGQTVSPVTHKRLLTFARMVFHYANEDMGPERPDMSEVYNQQVFDAQLKRCTDHVRKWLKGSTRFLRIMLPVLR